MSLAKGNANSAFRPDWTIANNLMRGRAGFTLVELALTAAVLAIVLLVLSDAAAYVRNQGMAQFTRDVLAQAQVAISDYRARTGEYPPDRFAPGWVHPTASHLPPTEGVECMVAALTGEQDKPFWTAGRFQRAMSNTDGDRNTVDLGTLNELVDGWGRAMLYYHGFGAAPGQAGLPIPDIPGVTGRQMGRMNASLAERWVQNGRRPLLDSAGPDGRFDNSDDVRLIYGSRSGESDERSTSQYD